MHKRAESYFFFDFALVVPWVVSSVRIDMAVMVGGGLYDLFCLLLFLTDIWDFQVRKQASKQA